MIILKLLLIFSTFCNSLAEIQVGSFISLQHNVQGDVYFTNDDTVLEIRNFNYDGKLF